MSVLELHAFPASPPSRAVHMTLDLLGLEYKYVETAVLEGATRTPEYLSINPQHTVPVLTDGNLVITESRAAMTYLVSQHKPGQLYPACAKKRSQIDQRLYFNIGTFYQRMGDSTLYWYFVKSVTNQPTHQPTYFSTSWDRPYYVRAVQKIGFFLTSS